MGHTVNHFVPQSKSHQRDHILRLLREAKLRGEGVRKADLLFGYHYTQCAARIWELEQQGFKIDHRSVPSEKFVVFFLISEPDTLSHPWKKPFSQKRMGQENCLQLVLPGVES